MEKLGLVSRIGDSGSSGQIGSCLERDGCGLKASLPSPFTIDHDLGPVENSTVAGQGHNGRWSSVRDTQMFLLDESVQIPAS